MKKLLCALMALAVMTCGFALAETIAPQFEALNTQDATYNVTFDRNDIQNGVMNNVHLTTEDVYDIVDVQKMAVGDTFEAEGRQVTIEALDQDEFGHITINGGMDAENGYTLTTEEGTNGYMTLLDDDLTTHTERGVENLPMAENITLTDSWNIEAEPVTATGIEAVTQAIQSSENEFFTADSTTVTIEGGQVTQINRVYVP